jgi:hypothetical protein
LQIWRPSPSLLSLFQQFFFSVVSFARKVCFSRKSGMFFWLFQ